jgi:hypothetical protein
MKGRVSLRRVSIISAIVTDALYGTQRVDRKLFFFFNFKRFVTPIHTSYIVPYSIGVTNTSIVDTNTIIGDTNIGVTNLKFRPPGSIELGRIGRNIFNQDRKLFNFIPTGVPVRILFILDYS